MTATQTKTPEPQAAPAAAPGGAELLTTGDHKRLGVAYLVTALFFLLVGAVTAGVIQAELVDPGRDVFDAGHDGQLFTVHAVTSTFLFLAPVWVGFATYVVPLQIGARRLALPRLHALAYWLFLGGGLIVVASYLVDGGPFAARALLEPSGLGQRVGRASGLWVLGMGAVSVAAVLAAASLVTTIALQRAPGLTLVRLPPFTFATLAASTVVVLAVPVFVAGLVLLWVDGNHGGEVFDGRGGLVMWHHTVSIYGRPELYAALLLPALGAVAEIVPVLARRALVAYRPLLSALSAVGALSFLVWAADTYAVDSASLPAFSPAAALVWAPVGLVALICLGTLARGRPKPTAALALAVGYLLATGVGGLGTVAAAVADVDARSQWVTTNAHLLLFASPVLAVLAAFHWWAPKIWGRHLSEGLGYLTFLLVLGGAVLAFAPRYLLGDQPLLSGVYGADAPDDWATWNRVAAAGTAVLAVGVLVFVANLAGSVLGRRGRPATADPWQGTTLEWLTTSPPPPHNFGPGDLPEIRSEQPLRPSKGEG